ncbi:protein phosphatase 2C 32-like isoform X2 [Phalaenopsis equestris]|uniref:protein phosphatase 2C 32-like isoform X2 n=1 Tax=Phalaenopsis equestris TaxID=78828 RepID=UPI0009E4EA96|nr:protein phosphatase 2C 32-like isoform X2 [Phalaenopsis equestris]
MGNSPSRVVCCFRPFRNGSQDVNFEFLEPLDEGLGHSFCYVRPVIADSPAITPFTSDRYTACSSTVDTETQWGSFRQEVMVDDLASLQRHSSSLPETTFKTISGASVSANVSTARSGCNLNQLLSGEMLQPAASFESTASFAAIPLQPVPRGSGTLNGFMSGALDKGAFMSGPIDNTERSNFAASLTYVHGKGRIKRLVGSMSRPMRSAFSRIFGKPSGRAGRIQRLIMDLMRKMVWHPEELKLKHVASRNFDEGGASEHKYRDMKNLQWAHGKAGEDRVHVVLSEEQGWLFVGIYDGFSGPDAPDFLMSNLYMAIDKELEDVGGEDILLPDPHNVATENKISNSQLCNDLSKDKNSEEVYNFQARILECGGKSSVEGELDTEPTQGDEKAESRSLDCLHIASVINQDQSLKMDNKNAAMVSEANSFQGNAAVDPPADNTISDPGISKHLYELLQLELVKNPEDKDSRFASDAACGSSRNLPLHFIENSEIQLVSCSADVGVRSSGRIEPIINRETEYDSAEKHSDPKEHHMPPSSSTQKKIKRSLFRSKLKKLRWKRKSLLKKLIPWSYDWHRDQLHLTDGTTNPSVAVPKCKSGPVDHDAVMKALARALEITEEAYADMVERSLDTNPELALMGSCVLVMLMKDQDVYVMNLGDSRVVLAQDRASDRNSNAVLMMDDSRFQNRSRESIARVELDRISEEFPTQNPTSHVCRINKNEEISLCKLKLMAVQLSKDHSTSMEEEVLRVKAEHVDDPQVVFNGRVKGQLKVTRAFGAEFLKQPKFNNALLEMFRVDYVGTSPYLSCEPSLVHHRLCSSDRFLILSSDGLYEYFSNEEVISHVAWFIENVPDGDPAQYLIAELLFRAAKKNGMDFHELLDIPHGDRRKYHDDVSVMVISLEGRIWRSSG